MSTTGTTPMARFLFTGAAGFVGSNVLKHFMDEYPMADYTCVCSWRHKGNPLLVPRNRRVEVVTHDLAAPIPEIGTFDYVLNFASESHVDRSIADPVAFIENNIKATLNLLEYARLHPPKRFIQFSTDEVFGQNFDGELAPSNPYAASKAAQEMIAMSYRKTYNLPVVITNSNNIVGPNQNHEKFVPKLIKMIKAGGVVPIHATNGRPGRRFYNPVENVAAALDYIISYIDDPLLRYSIPGGIEKDNLEMAKLVSTILNLPFSGKLVEAATVRPGYDEFYAAVGGGHLRAAGFVPPVDSLENGLSWIK